MSHAINTTHGETTEDALARTVIFEDRPDEFVIAIEWRLTNHDHAACEACSNPENPRPDGRTVLVRRDAHVILKRATVTADAIAGGF